MGSESIAHEAEGRKGYLLGGHERERNNCFSKIRLVGQKYSDTTNLLFEGRLWKLYTQLMQLRKESLKKIQACTGFEPSTSVLAPQCPSN